MSLTDEQIEALDCVDLVRECYEVFSVDRASVQTFARRIESATAAPLLELVAELEQQLEAARKDAERYRWLRNFHAGEDGIRDDLPHIAAGGNYVGAWALHSKEADDAIDAAISKESPA